MGIIFVACFAPSLAFLGYFYIRDEYEREPLHLVLAVYGGGMLAGPLSLLLFDVIERTNFYADLTDIDLVPDFKKLIYAVFAIALIEELSKFLVFWWFVDRKHVDFDEPVDGVVYAAAAALGFATIENWYFMIEFDARRPRRCGRARSPCPSITCSSRPSGASRRGSRTTKTGDRDC